MSARGGIQHRLRQWATQQRDGAQMAMDQAAGGSIHMARTLGRREAFDDMIEYIESEAWAAPKESDVAGAGAIVGNEQAVGAIWALYREGAFDEGEETE